MLTGPHKQDLHKLMLAAFPGSDKQELAQLLAGIDEKWHDIITPGSNSAEYFELIEKLEARGKIALFAQAMMGAREGNPTFREGVTRISNHAGPENGLPSLETYEDIRDWLRREPYSVSVVIAARSAMRLTPWLRYLFTTKLQPSDITDIILPSFYATATALSVAHMPDKVVGYTARADADADAAARVAAAIADAIADAARAAVDAHAVGAVVAVAAAAADAAATDPVASAAIAAATRSAAVVIVAAAADVAVVADAIAALASDRKYLHQWPEAKSSAYNLSRQLLWPDMDEGLPDLMLPDWTTLKKRLLAWNPHWSVWTDWYEHQVRGDRRPGRAAVELERLGIIRKYLDRGADLVNEHLFDLEAQYDAFISGGGALAYGSRFDAQGDYLSSSAAPPATAETPDPQFADREVLGQPAVAQLYETLQRKVKELHAESRGCGEKLNWDRLEAASARLKSLFDCDLSSIPNVIIAIHDAAMELATMVYEHRRLMGSPSGNKGPLSPALERALQNLINTLAPWVRRFPSALALDQELGDALARKELFEPVKHIFAAANDAALIAPDGQAQMDNMLRILDGDDSAELAKQRAYVQGSAHNLIIAAMGALTHDRVLSTDKISSELAAKSAQTIQAAEADIKALFADAPQDLRLSVEDWLKRLKEEDGE